MPSYREILAGLLVIGSISAATTASAQTGSRLGPSVPAITAVVKGSSVAYDSRNSRYLVASAYGDLNGRFVGADGDLIGVPFTIQSGAAGATHFPGVAYSPDAFGGAGGFLVAWHKSEAVGATVYGRMVSSSGALGTVFQFTTDGSWWEAAVDIAYSTTSREFLVVWQAAGIRAQRVNNNGEPLAPPAAGVVGGFLVTGTDYHRDPSVAYNPASNEFMVVYAGADGISAYAAARRVAAGSGALLGAETLLNRASGTYITDVAYNPATNRYLAAWYQGGTFGRLLDAAGNNVSDVLLLATRFTSYDGLGIDYSPVSGTFMMVAHDALSLQDGAVQLTGAGAVPDAGFVATDIPTRKGNYYPKIAARRDRAEWLMSTATDFAMTTVQRLQSGGTGGGGGGGGGTHTPPPPPCTATPTVTNLTLPGSGLTFPVDVNAASTCAWSATSSAPWLQVWYNATATGSASVGVTGHRNTSSSPRRATLSIGGQTVNVYQGGFNPAAVHDVNGDGLSDLVWQHQTTGALALWTLRGHTVTSTALFDSAAGIPDTTWKIGGTGDLSGDGYADLVWQRTDGTLAVWYMRGTAQVGSALLSIANAGPNWKVRGVGDVNADGKSDIIWQHERDGWLAVWLMDGARVVSTQMLDIPRMMDPTWTIAGTGDINNDGRADIIWQNQASGALGAWLLNGNRVVGQSGLSISGVSDLSWKVRGVGDANGDGFADLLWQNETTGGLGVWYLNGYRVTEQRTLSIGHVGDLDWMVVGPG